MEKKTFLVGAVILGIAGLMVQILGAVFRIPLANIIGPAGMGYYQTAYPLYIFLLVFSTNGAPAAISKMTSERLALGRIRDAHRVFKMAFLIMSVLGLIAFLAVFIFAESIVSAFGDPGAVMAMKAIAPALLVVPIMSVYRGYFQGMQNMGPTATSQLIEQGVRVTVGLSLAILWMKYGIEQAAAGATIGTSVGPLAGVLVLILIYNKRREKILVSVESDLSTSKESNKDIIKTLIWIAVPITVGVSILPIINLGDLFVLMNRLSESGFSISEANVMYGQLSGMAGPIINIPMALALSMALALVPAIASAKASGDVQLLNKNIQLGFRTAMIVGVPCSFGLIILAKPIMTLLYPIEMESAINASGSLAYLAMGVIFLCVAQTMAGTLQGLGKPGVAVVGLLIGFAVKLIATYVLAGITALNMEGAAIASALAYATIGLFNLWAVKRITGISFDRRLTVFKPVLAGIIMFILSGVFYRIFDGILGNSLACVGAILVAAIVYGVILLRIKGITQVEIRAFPKGDKIANLLIKMKLV